MPDIATDPTLPPPWTDIEQQLDAERATPEFKRTALQQWTAQSLGATRGKLSVPDREFLDGYISDQYAKLDKVGVGTRVLNAVKGGAEGLAAMALGGTAPADAALTGIQDVGNRLLGVPSTEENRVFGQPSAITANRGAQMIQGIRQQGTGEHADRLTGLFDALKVRADAGQLPKEWFDGWAQNVKQSASAMNGEGLGLYDQPAKNPQSPENVQLLGAYQATRDPKYLKEYRDRLTSSATTEQASQNIANELDKSPEAIQGLIAASADPLNIATVPLLGGGGAVRGGFRGLATAAAKGAGAVGGIGLLSQQLEHPNATLSERAEVLGQGALTGGLLGLGGGLLAARAAGRLKITNEQAAKVLGVAKTPQEAVTALKTVANQQRGANWNDADVADILASEIENHQARQQAYQTLLDQDPNLADRIAEADAHQEKTKAYSKLFADAASKGLEALPDGPQKESLRNLAAKDHDSFLRLWDYLQQQPQQAREQQVMQNRQAFFNEGQQPLSLLAPSETPLATPLEPPGLPMEVRVTTQPVPSLVGPRSVPVASLADILPPSAVPRLTERPTDSILPDALSEVRPADRQPLVAANEQPGVQPSGETSSGLSVRAADEQVAGPKILSVETPGQPKIIAQSVASDKLGRYLNDDKVTNGLYDPETGNVFVPFEFDDGRVGATEYNVNGGKQLAANRYEQFKDRLIPVVKSGDNFITQSREPNASPSPRLLENDAEQKLPRIPPRPDVQPDAGEVRQENRERPTGGSGAGGGSAGAAEGPVARSPEQTLLQSPKVKLSLPKEATGMAYTNEGGLRKYIAKAELERGNILQGSPVRDVAPARLVGGKIQKVPGVVGVEEAQGGRNRRTGSRYSSSPPQAGKVNLGNLPTDVADYLKRKYNAINLGWFDSDNPIARLMAQKGIKFSDESNPYLAKTLLPGALQDAQEHAVSVQKDMVSQMVATAKSYQMAPEALREAVNDYLYAQHAPERNRSLGENAAGITDAEAQAKMEALKKLPVYPEIQKFAQQIRGMADDTLGVLVEGEIITPEFADKLHEKYENYVPLQRVFDEPGDKPADWEGGLASGQGLNVKGTGIKRAKGSEREVADIAGNVWANYQAALSRAKKNLVDLNTLRFLRENESTLNPKGEYPTFSIEKPKVIGASGERPIYTPPPQDKLTLSMREGGKPVYIRINDPELSASLQGTNVFNPDGIMGALASVNRLMANMLTRFNPNFGIPNLLRDTQDLAMSLNRMVGDKASLKAPAYQLTSMKAVGDYMRGKDTPLSQQYAEMRRLGGTTGGFALSTRSDVLKNLDTLFKQANQRPIDPRVWGRKVGTIVDHFNGVLEDASRLTAFRLALENGKTPKQAAYIAKEATLNFNRFGKYSKQLNSFYVFANAGLQGLRQLKRNLSNPKTALKTIAALSAATTAISLWNDSQDDNWRTDVRPIDLQNGIPVVTGRNDDGTLKYFVIPVAYPLRPLKVAADEIYNVSFGKNTGERAAQDAAMRIASAMASTINPLGGSNLRSALTPTLGDTALDVAMNESFTGNRIRPDNPDIDQTQNYFPSTDKTAGGRLAIKAAQWLKDLTGIEISPNDIQYVAQQFGGGPLQSINQLTNLGESALNGEIPATRDIPLASRFLIEQKPEQFDRRRVDLRDLQDASKQEKTERYIVSRNLSEAHRDASKLPESERAAFLQQQARIGRIPDLQGSSPESQKARESYQRLDQKYGGSRYTPVLLGQGIDDGVRAKSIEKILQNPRLSPAVRQQTISQLVEDKAITPAVWVQLENAGAVSGNPRAFFPQDADHSPKAALFAQEVEQVRKTTNNHASFERLLAVPANERRAVMQQLAQEGKIPQDPKERQQWEQSMVTMFRRAGMTEPEKLLGGLQAKNRAVEIAAMLDMQPDNASKRAFIKTLRDRGLLTNEVEAEVIKNLPARP